MGGGPRGKGNCGGAKAAGRALKAGDQVWAPLGQEGAHLSLDGLEMKGAHPPPPEAGCPGGNQSPGLACLVCLHHCLIYGNCLPPTLPHRLKLNNTKGKNSPFTQCFGLGLQFHS